MIGKREGEGIRAPVKITTTGPPDAADEGIPVINQFNTRSNWKDGGKLSGVEVEDVDGF